MRLVLSDEEVAIRDAFAGFFLKECSTEVVRDAAPFGFSRDLWRKLAETGACGMALPESFETTDGSETLEMSESPARLDGNEKPDSSAKPDGSEKPDSQGTTDNIGGGGANLVELGILASLCGAHIAPVPFVEHAVASRLLVRAVRCRLAERTAKPEQLAEAGDTSSYSPTSRDTEFLTCLFSQIADGECIASLALRPATTSECQLMPAGAVADVFIAFKDGQLLAIKSPPPFVSLPNTADLPIAHRKIPELEECEPQAREPQTSNLATSEPQPADSDLPQVAVLTDGPDAACLYDLAISEWKALTAMSLWGLGNRAMEIGVDYALERHQFGRPIGSFQAVQHGLADAATELEAAYYMSQKALWLLDTTDPEQQNATAQETATPEITTNQITVATTGEDNPHTLASMAFLFASETAMNAAAASLQFHGGYGYAEEYDIGLYYRRAKGWSLIYDDPAQEYQRLASAMLDAAKLDAKTPDAETLATKQ